MRNNREIPLKSRQQYIGFTVTFNLQNPIHRILHGEC